MFRKFYDFHFQQCATICVMLTIAALVCIRADAREINVEPSTLAVVARQVQDADFYDRTDFARIALNELTLEYESELEVIRDEKKSTRSAQMKSYRWQNANIDFLNRLIRTRNALDTTLSIEIVTDRRDRVLIFVEDTAIVVNGPRHTRASTLEQRIVDAYCHTHACRLDEETASPDQQDATTGADRQITRRGDSWSFTNDGRPTFATHDELYFEFSDLKNRRAKQETSVRLASDLRAVRDALRYSSLNGHPVDWQSLSIDQLPEGDDFKIITNRQGDYIRLPLPALGQAQPVLLEALPWLKAGVENRTYGVTIRRVERYIN